MRYEDTCHVTDLRAFDTMVPEIARNYQLADGVLFRTLPYCYETLEGASFVNVYAVDLTHNSSWRFDMHFAQRGEHCVTLANIADKASSNALLCAMNCNFGLIADDLENYPPDIAYNLHVENGSVFQLPVADKTALLIDEAGHLTMSFLQSRGTLTLQHHVYSWAGSLSHRSNDDSLPTTLVAYNAYNAGLLRVPHDITGTRQLCDPTSSFTPLTPTRTDLVFRHDGTSLRLTLKRPNGSTHVFSGHLLLSAPNWLADTFEVGSAISSVTLSGVPLSQVTGATSGAILTQNDDETERNILASQVIQTRDAQGRAVVTGNPRFCRACIIEQPWGWTLLLADARKGVVGQSGLTIAELRRMVHSMYPTYQRLTNVDGGHAAKMIIKRDGECHVYGNLHYKIWPTRSNPRFVWDGYHGRRIPAILSVRTV